MFLRTDSRTSLDDWRTQTRYRTCSQMLRGLAERAWTHLHNVQQAGWKEQQQASHTVEHKLSSQLAVQLFKVSYKDPGWRKVENEEKKSRRPWLTVAQRGLRCNYKAENIIWQSTITHIFSLRCVVSEWRRIRHHVSEIRESTKEEQMFRLVERVKGQGSTVCHPVLSYPRWEH